MIMVLEDHEGTTTLSFNPLPFNSDELFALLKCHSDGLSEHAVLKHFKRPLMEPWQLFQNHFELFHALYTLRDSLWQCRQADLQISPLHIVLHPYPTDAATRPVRRATDALRDYYLDRRNAETMTPAQVAVLLAGFRQDSQTAHPRRYAHPHRQAALDLLGLHDPVDWPTIKRRYRALAMRHHPDRGGKTETLQALHAALEVLKEGL